MPTYLFISGKNWMLSLAELTAYFAKKQCLKSIFSGIFHITEKMLVLYSRFNWNHKSAVNQVTTEISRKRSLKKNNPK
jgi:hypothetical protein